MYVVIIGALLIIAVGGVLFFLFYSLLEVKKVLNDINSSLISISKKKGEISELIEEQNRILKSGSKKIEQSKENINLSIKEREEIKSSVLREEAKRNQKILDNINALREDLYDLKKRIEKIESQNIIKNNKKKVETITVESSQKKFDIWNKNKDVKENIKNFRENGFEVEEKEDYFMIFLQENESVMIVPKDGLPLNIKLNSLFEIISGDTKDPDNNIKKVVKPAIVKVLNDNKFEKIEGGKLEYVY